MKILLIEDEPTSMKLASLVLSLDGHQILESCSAEAALDMILKKKPDIILLDLNLPGKDGLTLASELKKKAETRHIPIIAMTAYPQRFSKSQALQVQCDAYIIKPINTRTIGEQVSSVAALTPGATGAEPNPVRDSLTGN